MHWKIRQSLTIFCISFPVKVTCEGIFLLKLQAVLPTAILPKMNFCCRFFLNFWQKVSANHFYSLLSLKFISQKKSVLLELPHLITLLPRLNQSNEIYLAASWWAFCSNDISLNVTLISTACHWIVSRWIIKHLRMERGKRKYGNEVISILLSLSNNFSKDNYPI